MSTITIRIGAVTEDQRKLIDRLSPAERREALLQAARSILAAAIQPQWFYYRHRDGSIRKSKTLRADLGAPIENPTEDQQLEAIEY